MGIESISVTGYKKSFSSMNLELYNDKRELYDACLGYAEIMEFNQGFKVKKVGKATKKGTSITFQAIESPEEYNKIRADIVERYKHILKNSKEV